MSYISYMYVSISILLTKYEWLIVVLNNNEPVLFSVLLNNVYFLYYCNKFFFL